MKKIGLVVDSSSNLSQAEANKKGVGMVPLLINLNGNVKKGGIDIQAHELYSLMEKGKTKISTATPMGEDLINVFTDMLTKYDEIVFVGISHKFSGTQNNARMIVSNHDEFKGKVHIYESQFSAPWTGMLIEEMKEIVENSSSIEEIYKKFDFQKDKMIGWLSPGDIYWFYQGGRIDKKQYLIGSALRVKPILTIKDGEIDQKTVIKGISVKNALGKMLKQAAVVKEEFDAQGLKYEYMVLDGGNPLMLKQTKDAVADFFKIDSKDIIASTLSAEQTAHMGPGAFGISFKVSFK